MNLKHLRYFWAVVRWGGVHKAAAQLHLTPQTLSGQIKAFEAQLGVELIRFNGRKLELTEAGRVAHAHAEELFRIADELKSALQSLPAGQPVRFRVGVSDGVPRSLAHHLLRAATDGDERVRLACSHEPMETLLADLALHRLDLVLSDRPVPAGSAVRVFNHALGSSAVGLFAVDRLARRLRRGFPASMDGKPLLLPGSDNAANRNVLAWFEQRRVLPRVLGEFDDSALMKTFGAAGAGVLPAPLAIRAEIQASYGLRLVGTADGLTERYYAVSAERRTTDPITCRILAQASTMLEPPRAA